MGEPRKTRLRRLAQWLSQGETRARREFWVLRVHFFRRFFDNDTLRVEGDMATATAQAMMLAALPSMLAGLLVVIGLLYGLPMAVGNFYDYFFVLYTFAGMGVLAVFEWEMLFADRSDFLILTPLPLRKREMLGAKVEAMARFMGMFLLAANALSTVLVPGAAGHLYPMVVAAHAVSVVMAGSFAALLVLVVHSALLCVLRGAWRRRVLPLVQITMVACMVWMVAELPLFFVASRMPGKAPPGILQWLPPLWFVGVYDVVLLRGTAPEFVRTLALRGICALVLMAVAAAAMYPLAWRRKQSAAMEDATGRSGGGPGWVTSVLMRARGPEARAVFAFAGQTLRRNQRYQTYLTVYGGVGLALAGACAVRVAPGAVTRVVVSDGGLHVLMPLLLFWLIVGLRAAFAMPVELTAGWVFPMCGVELGRCAAAARQWVELQAMGLVVVVLGVLRAAHWGGTRLAVQAVCGVSLAVLLTEALFALRRGVPFTRPRLPGKNNVAIAVALYMGVLPLLAYLMFLESSLEARPRLLWVPLAVAAALRLAVRWSERGREPVFELLEEEMEGTLTLGLS